MVRIHQRDVDVPGADRQRNEALHLDCPSARRGRQFTVTDAEGDFVSGRIKTVRSPRIARTVQPGRQFQYEKTAFQPATRYLSW